MFQVDNRPKCQDDEEPTTGIICLNPFENKENCEVYQPVTQNCYDKDGTICIDWLVVIETILITNLMGLIFETAFSYSFELTLRPT